MLNGFAGYFPAGYNRLQGLLNAEFPSYRSLCALAREAGITTVIIDRPWEASGHALIVDQDSRRLLMPVYRDEEVEIFRLEPTSADCLVQP
jgi:hypothetical protein